MLITMPLQYSVLLSVSKIALSEKKETKFDLLPSINVSTGYNDNITSAANLSTGAVS
jgi:hypothetical protein